MSAAVRSTYSATSPALRPPNRTRRVVGSRATSASSAPSGAPGTGSTSRKAPSTRRWLEPSSRATNCRSRSEGVSAAWRSSSTSTSGRRCEARRRNSAVASKSRKRAPSESADSGSAIRGAAGGARAGDGSARRRRGRPRRSVFLRVAVANVHAQRLHPGPVGRRAAGLPAATKSSCCRASTLAVAYCYRRSRPASRRGRSPAACRGRGTRPARPAPSRDASSPARTASSRRRPPRGGRRSARAAAATATRAWTCRTPSCRRSRPSGRRGPRSSRR